MNQFVPREAEMQDLRRLFQSKPPETSQRRVVVVVHGLGGIGKTQLAVEFAREHQRRFSAIFWLDGSSEINLKQSFVGMVQRLPQDELTADGVGTCTHSVVDVNVAVHECLRWLSLSSNHDWLLIIDNVDRDHLDKDDPQSYNVKGYFPPADHGSILITSRLASLQKHGSGVKVGTVAAEQARAILENNAGRDVKNADVILERLNGLPLALTQAGSYMRETNLSASAYAKHYDTTWERLMKKQGRFPLEEYGDRNVLTTWILSYEQVRKQSKKAVCLLKLWGFLDYGELWYELIVARRDLAQQMDIPAWLVHIAEDELEFTDAMGLLLRYSLADANEDTSSYSMHSVLHKWCGQLAEGEERYGLSCVAAGLVASNVPLESEAEYWKKQKRVLAHGTNVSGWIVEVPFSDAGETIGASVLPWALHRLGDLLSNGDRLKQAEEMYQRALQGYEKAWGPEHTLTLNTVNNLGNLYTNLGRLSEAEEMYQRALQGYEKAWGPEHTLTLNTVNNLGNLYKNLGRLSEAERTYQRALQGKEKAWGLEHTSTLNTVNNLGILYKNLGRLSEAEKMYQRALQGYEKAWGPEHTLTLDTVNNLGNLYADLGRLDEAERMYIRVLQSCERTSNLDHTSARNALGGLHQVYRCRLVSLRQEQSAHRWANLVNPSRQYKEHTIVAVTNLCKEMGAVWPTFFSLLGRILIWAEQDDGAVLAFQHQFCLAESKPEQGSTVCDGCDIRLYAGMTRLVCKACVDVDLCEECYKEYEIDGFVSRGSAENCQGHPFLAVPGEKGKLHAGTSSPDVSLTQWLTSIQIQHGTTGREV
ncbi:hypothetical protein GQ44DRAFT_159935 [Phaeosphaeriaceae sp. PMI808]|nr:hypothetical protein GQ44DRAFT_159935 [Phaeosphaeriaceae sp. PMI808]